MLTHPTLEKMRHMKLLGMAHGFEEQMGNEEYQSLTFEERLGLLIDLEETHRDNRKTKTRLRQARLKQSALVEDVDYKHPRGLDKSLYLQLATCDWIRRKENCAFTGPTGCGKTYLSCSLGNKACREGLKCLYIRLPRLFERPTVSKCEGTYEKLLKTFARQDLLILDDWGITPLTDENRRDLLEIFDDRHAVRSTIITSQLPVKKWHAYIGDPTLADAILDRLVHNAHKIMLKGESIRKTRSPLTNKRK